MDEVSSRVDRPLERRDDWNVWAAYQVLRRSWLLLGAIGFAGAALGYAASYLLTPIYQADALLIATDEITGVSQSNVAGGAIGGLAALAGIGAPDNRQNEAKAFLSSRELTRKYVADHHLLPVLFSSKWDSSAGRWKDESPGKVPTLNDAYNLINKKVRTVTEDRKTGLITISVRWTDPELAAQWTQDFVNLTNDWMRQQAIDRSNRNLDYLNEQINKNSVIELRATMYRLIESEIKKVMVAQGGKDYAFRVIDPPVVPEKKVSPNRISFLAVGGLLAGGILFLVLYRRMLSAQ